jgi:hypothetical protein
MTKCSICESVFLGDIDKMISTGSNHKYVQQWCRERKFKVTLGAIENHQVDHLQQIEKTQVKLEGIDTVYLTIGQIEEQLDLSSDCLLAYLKSNKIKINTKQTYDVIEIISYIARNLSTEVIELKERLSKITVTDDKEVLRELKNKKLEVQTRLQTAIASLKEIKLKQLQGELLGNKELESQWSYSLVGFKAKLESIPNKVSLELSSINNPQNVNCVLTKLITEALEELGNGSPTAI